MGRLKAGRHFVDPPRHQGRRDSPWVSSAKARRHLRRIEAAVAARCPVAGNPPFLCILLQGGRGQTHEPGSRSRRGISGHRQESTGFPILARATECQRRLERLPFSPTAAALWGSCLRAGAADVPPGHRISLGGVGGDHPAKLVLGAGGVRPRRHPPRRSCVRSGANGRGCGRGAAIHPCRPGGTTLACPGCGEGRQDQGDASRTPALQAPWVQDAGASRRT